MIIHPVRPVARSRMPDVRWLAVYGCIAAFLAVFPAFLPSYSIGLVQTIMVFGLLAISVDLIYGYGGLPSLGQAAYFGIGGYAAGQIMLKADITSIWVVMPAGVVVSAAAAALFGLIALRTAGLYFLLVTFALGQLLAAIALNWSWLQSLGVQGIVGISFPTLGGDFTWGTTSQYYLVLVVFALCYAGARQLVRSPLGYAARGVRENQQRMAVLGYNSWRCKYAMFIIAGSLAGVAGELFAFTSGSVLPTNLDITYSALAFLMVVLGGAGTIYGAVIGAAVIELLDYYVGSAIPDRWPLILGGVFVATAAVSRRGAVGIVEDLRRKLAKRWMPSRSTA